MDATYWQFNHQAAVSVIQLMDDGFIRCLCSSEMAPQKLHLEVTESTSVENIAKIRQ